jgi:CDP-diacylglycerol--glycerol-3-phosphate 3-phosphatidyltransferase
MKQRRATVAHRWQSKWSTPLVQSGLVVLAAAAFSAVTWPLFPERDVMGASLHPALIAGGCWAGQLWYATRVSPARALRATAADLTGLANVVTLVRGGLFAVVASFAVVPRSTTLVWVPALCYGAGALLDGFDGALARTIGSETRVGNRLDLAFDTFGFVAAPLVAVLWGRLPLSALRYVYRGGLSYRRLRGRTVYDRPDSDLGKYLAGLQMGFLTVALAPAVPVSLIHAGAPIVLAPSVAVFARDFLVASGRLRWGTDREN